MAERGPRAYVVGCVVGFRYVHRPGRPVGRVHRAATPRSVDAAPISLGGRHCRSVRFHLYRGGMDGHGIGTPAVDHLWRPQDRGRRHPDARADRAVPDNHARVLRPRRHRRTAALRSDREKPRVTPSLADILAGIILVALTAYVLFGGADFGGGVWSLLATGPRKAQQRDVIAHAIAPVWEANHVWLILAIVLLFTCFPRAFATIAVGLHVPLTLMLIGIVLRGSAFVFQSYGGGGGRVFATASLVTPVLLGMCVGAVASGTVWWGVRDGSFVTSFIGSWLTPFAFAVGVFTLA